MGATIFDHSSYTGNQNSSICSLDSVGNSFEGFTSLLLLNQWLLMVAGFFICRKAHIHRSSKCTEF